VRASLLLTPGEPYSAAELEDARRALINLGVFSSVTLEVDTSRPDLTAVPIAFVVGETSPRTLRLGVGARVDSLAFATRLTASWEHRNFLGGLRRLAVETRPGLLMIPTLLDDLQTPERGLFTNRFRVELQQPSFLEGRTRGLLSADFNVLPLLYSDTEPDEPIIGFLEVKTQAGVERAFLSHHLFASPTLNWQAEFPVDYSDLSFGVEPARPPETGLDDVIILYPSLDLRLDFRDSPTEPTRGVMLANNVQVALPVLGANVKDVRIQPELRAYATKSRITLAVRATTGLLFPFDYGDTLTDDDSFYLSREQILDQQKLLFRAFFSGGAQSNRGYPYRGVGPHKVLGYLGNPSQRCNLSPMDPIDRRCLRPVGGLTLWELSLELRFPVDFLDPLGAALFVDSSDVRQQRFDYGLSDPHVSPGFSLRYPTPIGPLRLDLGLRLFEALGKEEPQGTPPRLLGAPITLHFSIGEAF
jgi:outer membrane protein assembly factor BamA